ncbi:MAG: phage major capsid protein [Oscillospiraceae bacterium]|nr:phage major capsid protein [Oscillospiraceae bacterium]
MEKIKGFSIDEVESRMAEIRSLNLDECENIDELTKEVDALEARKQELKERAETKAELRNKIMTGEVKTNKIEKPQEKRTMEFTKDTFMATAEYRNGFYKQLLGREVNAEERAALALAGASAVIPTETQNSIMELAKEFAPVLNDVTLLHVNGGVKFAVEGINEAAKAHEEGAALTPDAVNLVVVELSTHEVVKQVMISSAVKSMTIPAFESWLTKMLAEAVARYIEAKIFTDMAASATKAVTGAVSVENIAKLFGSLKSDYYRKAKVYMNNKTLWTVRALQDKSKNDLYIDGKVYEIEARTTASLADGVVLLCDPTKYVANLSEDITVKGGEDLKTNSYIFNGVANFDGKVAIAEAFVKLSAE